MIIFENPLHPIVYSLLSLNPLLFSLYIYYLSTQPIRIS